LIGQGFHRKWIVHPKTRGNDELHTVGEPYSAYDGVFIYFDLQAFAHGAVASLGRAWWLKGFKDEIILLHHHINSLITQRAWRG
jgi:hypothetical protein